MASAAAPSRTAQDSLEIAEVIGYYRRNYAAISKQCDKICATSGRWRLLASFFASDIHPAQLEEATRTAVKTYDTFKHDRKAAQGERRKMSKQFDSLSCVPVPNPALLADLRNSGIETQNVGKIHELRKEINPLLENLTKRIKCIVERMEKEISSAGTDLDAALYYVCKRMNMLDPATDAILRATWKKPYLDKWKIRLNLNAKSEEPPDSAVPECQSMTKDVSDAEVKRFEWMRDELIELVGTLTPPDPNDNAAPSVKLLAERAKQQADAAALPPTEEKVAAQPKEDSKAAQPEQALDFRKAAGGDGKPAAAAAIPPRKSGHK